MSERPQMQRYERTGLLCVDPRAFFELFAVPTKPREVAITNGVAVIDVSGPLVQREEHWSDSYESIRGRVKSALESPEARAVLLRIDSPGGDASGCFETARAIRADCAAARKPLLAYIDRACSAAYGLASAANLIGIGETCQAGSIGVIATRPDCTLANMMRGLRMAFVTSGQRKLDGNPDAPLTEAELAATQAHVDELAQVFFALVSEHRPLTTDAVAAFDGALFYGASAVSAGLADQLITFDELLAQAAKGEVMSTPTLQQNVTRPEAKGGSEYDSVRTALAKLAKGKDANAAAARKALAALGAAEGDETPPPPDDEEDPMPDEAAEDEAETPAAVGDGKGEPAAASGSEAPDAAGGGDVPASQTSAIANDPNVKALMAKMQRLEAAEAAGREARTRRKLLAQRPDFSPEIVALLKNAPIATLREAVEKLPKGKVQAKREPITTVSAARGGEAIEAPAAGGRTRYSADADALDRAFGFTTSKLGSKREGSTMYFGFVDEQRDTAAGDQK